MITKEMVSDFPSLPGVYFFVGKSGEILYIGKAKSLRRRVRSYLYNRKHKVKRLIKSADRVDYEICGSELEAFFLEAKLIKEHRPEYNCLYKNSQRHPYIKIDLNDEFSRVEVVFKVEPDGGRYFGPFSSLKWTEEAVQLLHKMFPIRTCDGKLDPNPNFRPCFSYHLNRCGAPCADRMSQKEYRLMIEDAIQFIDGDLQDVVKELILKREDAASMLEFERAAAIQKRVERLQKVSIYLKVHQSERG